jgi:hypothetical protein
MIFYLDQAKGWSSMIPGVGKLLLVQVPKCLVIQVASMALAWSCLFFRGLLLSFQIWHEIDYGRRILMALLPRISLTRFYQTTSKLFL